MSTSSLSSVQRTIFGHKTSSSMATTVSTSCESKKLETSNYSLAFNIPNHLYHLGVEHSKDLEDRARLHFNIHTNWLYAIARRDALEKALNDMRSEVEHLEGDLSAATKGLDDAISAGYVKLREEHLQPIAT
ncbi:hypothetical protein FIBSPDRAFT_969522 [Athelia psychrophila]|uniref:Uncharacterized protein n=1 Tax=Athelia psychrophila TaxID=1759441 RepID=A0A167TFA9_9AGAM|nr:hypothetical protein FIBSPDRAFT_969522 [Fibularhizoctonia sp. CBS 109695]